MPVHVPHARIWGLFRAASVAKSQLRGGASTLITLLAGVVTKSAETLCLAGSIPVRGHVMRDYAVPANFGLIHDVTVARWKSRLSAANVERRRKVQEHFKTMTQDRRWKIGWACSTAETHVRGCTTVASTFVKSNVIHRDGSHPTVLVRLILCPVALVERHYFQHCPAQYAHLAKIQFQIAPKNAREGCLAAISAGRSATLANVYPV